jgi:hypothetical protein
MVKKSLSVMAVVMIAVLGMLMFCNKDNPTTPQPASMNGVWSGLTSVTKIGANFPDTFTCVLRIDSAAGTYSMQRGHVNYGSSGSQVDSARESGTLTKIGADSLVLTPHSEADSTADSCFYYDNGLASWVQCDGSGTAMYRTCPDPMNIKIDISGTTWHVDIPRYDDFSSISYSLKKQ